MDGRQGPPAGGGMVGAGMKCEWDPPTSKVVLCMLVRKFRLNTSHWNGYVAEEPDVLPVLSLTATETS